MAQKKRLGKDPFASTPAVSEPQTPAPPAKAVEVKATTAKKASSAAKKTASSSSAAKAKTASAAPTAPKNDQPVAVVKPAVNERDKEIENIRKELAEIHAIVLRLQQQQMDFMKQWNENLLSPWQWWFSLFS